MGKSKIIGIRKNSNGSITDVMIDTGNIFTVNEAMTLVRDGVIEGVDIGVSPNGEQFLSSNQNFSNNLLEKLPLF